MNALMNPASTIIKTIFAAALTTATMLCPATESLTLITYNIHGGVPNGFSSANYTVKPRDVENIADVITTSGATICAMQEVRNEWELKRATAQNILPPDIPRLIAANCQMNYAFGSTIDDTHGYPQNTNYLEWGSGERWQNNGNRHGEFGNAILSQANFVNQPQNIALPTFPGQEQRACLRAELAIANTTRPVVVYATHLHHADPTSRERQMRAILSHAKTETTTATVFLLGDMNSNPNPKEPDLAGMAAAEGFFDVSATFAQQHKSVPPLTFSADKPDRRIDYIFASPNLPVLDVRTIETTASDHLPLVATVVLP